MAKIIDWNDKLKKDEEQAKKELDDLEAYQPLKYDTWARTLTYKKTKQKPVKNRHQTKNNTFILKEKKYPPAAKQYSKANIPLKKMGITNTTKVPKCEYHNEKKSQYRNWRQCIEL